VSIDFLYIMYLSLDMSLEKEVSMVHVKQLIRIVIWAILLLNLMVACSGLDAFEPTPTPWNLVAVGDSIPYNKPISCPTCTGFVSRYAETIQTETGHPVKVQNLSRLGGLRVDDLLHEVQDDPYRREALASADIIIVGIGFNDVAWSIDDDPCDGETTDPPDWSKYNTTCAVASAEVYRPKFETLFAQIVALREGKSTIFRTINRYNDWIGWTEGNFPPETTDATRAILDAWNAMICKAAEENGFLCADIYHAFNGSDGTLPSLDLLAGDYTHPSDKGNEVIALVLADLGYAPLVP
jgi:lysophospholipase L1-like esterase